MRRCRAGWRPFPHRPDRKIEMFPYQSVFVVFPNRVFQRFCGVRALQGEKTSKKTDRSVQFGLRCGKTAENCGKTAPAAEKILERTFKNSRPAARRAFSQGKPLRRGSGAASARSMGARPVALLPISGFGRLGDRRRRQVYPATAARLAGFLGSSAQTV